MSKYKVILCVYHWVGCKVLEHVLQREDISDVAVFTHKPTDETPDISEVAKTHDIYYSFNSINQSILPFKPDIISSVYYRYIIKPKIIRACNGKIFNMHPSLLPKHRGCSSVPWSIIEGDNITGVSFHYIDESIDTGRIILQAAIPIRDDETQATLYQTIMERGLSFWPSAFELVKIGISGVEQFGEPSYHLRGCPYNGEINDEWSLEKVERFIRAMIYPPYPTASYKGQAITSLYEYLKLSGR